MKTAAFSIANYCVPCHAHCRHCLLSSCGRAAGVDAEAGFAFAGRVLEELDEIRPELSTSFYMGYCMDAPFLPAYIRFCREHHSPGASFLQMNGFAFRDEAELRSLMQGIRESGAELIDLTFYGTEAYHDRFAGRQGDFRFLLRMLEAAERAGLQVNISIALIRENAGQMPELHRLLTGSGAKRFSVFLPHSKGRGRLLQDQRITREDLTGLPEDFLSALKRIRHQTEAEWLSSDEMPDPQTRSLTLVLTPEVLQRARGRSAGELLSDLEALDDRYLRELPSARALAERFGDPAGQRLYRWRDLLLKWQQQYIASTGGWDMRDETHHFSVHT